MEFQLSMDVENPALPLTLRTRQSPGSDTPPSTINLSDFSPGAHRLSLAFPLAIPLTCPTPFVPLSAVVPPPPDPLPRSQLPVSSNGRSTNPPLTAPFLLSCPISATITPTSCPLMVLGWSSTQRDTTQLTWAVPQVD